VLYHILEANQANKLSSPPPANVAYDW